LRACVRTVSEPTDPDAPVDGNAGERRVDVGPAGEDGVERADEVAQRRLLQHDGLGACVEHLRDDPGVGLGGVDGDPQPRARLAQLAHELAAREARHVVVDERQLRLELGRGRKSRVPVAGRRDDVVAVLAQQVDDGGDERGMVVRDDAARQAHAATSTGSRSAG
jgi:hypothetical protein